MSALAIETFQDMIGLALKNAGVVGVGQTANASDVNDACQLLNSMLGQWQRRRWLVYHIVENVITATDQQSYTVGPNGDFSVSVRPAEIVSAFARQTVNSNPNQIDYPIEVLPARETYNQIALKSLQSFPRWAYYDAAMPLGNLFVYPVITSQFEIHIFYPEILQSVTNLTDAITMPPEYVDALLYNLAVRLAGAYQIPLNPVVAAQAKASLETMRTVNAQVPRMNIPWPLLGRNTYNVFSDSSGWGGR